MDTQSFRRFTLLCSAVLVAAAPLAAQAPLTNAALKGAYFVRYLGVIGSPNDFPVSFAGSMTFDGNGSFTTQGSGVFFDTASEVLQVASTGSYTVQASGAVALSNAFNQGSGAVTLYGGVGAGGVVIASSTESNYLDLFVAIPQSTNASKATLSGTYRVAGLEFAGGSISSMRNVSFNATSDGNGNLGNLTLAGSSSALNDNAATQTSSGATYTLVSTGSGTITFPAPSGVSTASQLISGAKNLYVSPDGSFFVSGSPSGWDMQVGVKAITSGGGTIFSGLYFDAFVENVTGSNGSVNAAAGASNEQPSTPAEFVHERFNEDGFAGQAYDQTYSDSFTPGNDGTSSSSFFYFAAGAGGNYALQIGGGGDYFLQVWAKTSSFSGSGVFLNPTGVVNGASNSPFTAQISPGEMITLYGTGFTTSAQGAQSLPLPTTLGGVQVLINSTPVPLNYVSATQINAVVPYTTPSDGSLANIQVMSNGPSNIVQTYTGLTSPGIFTASQNGLGYGAILHADFSPVSASSPAKMGETVQLFLTGLGAVSPAVTAGTAAPSAKPATVVVPVDIFIDDSNGNFSQAQVGYQGLAPGFAGLYQVNFTVPNNLTLNATGVTPFTVEVSTLEQADGDNFQALIPISH